MFFPILRETYDFNLPLTEKERTAAKRHKDNAKSIKGKFRYVGSLKTKNPKLMFVAETTEEDGVFYAGAKVLLSPDEFDLGMDLKKIRGRAKVINLPKKKAA